MKLKLGEDKITFEVLEKYFSGPCEIVLSDGQRKKLQKVRDYVEGHISAEHSVYGINTGFGRLANEKISMSQLEELQVNLIRSHAFGVGEPLDVNIVRLMMLLRANVIAMGYSGASLGVVDLLAGMINKDVVPIVPSQGSVGASGDLSPLAFLALAMIGEGEVIYKDEIISAKDGLKKVGLKPVTLHAKDGLTLINGTQAMTAVAAVAILRARHLIKLMDISSALCVEGMRGSLAPFDADIHFVRQQPGQINSARMMRGLLKDSKIISSHANCDRVQDPYSLRCVPQVHGAVRDAFAYAEGVVLRELNCCTDNPLVFPESGKIVSGGNFHGEPLAIAMDTLSIAMAELGAISERRIEQLTNPKSHDLPVLFLTPKPGINSGFMIPHVVATSLASENKTLAHPASIDSMPTSAGQEDHVSMGMWAARKALKIIENVEWISVIETVSACQAIDLHEKKFEPGKGTQTAYDQVREYVKFMERDRWLMPEVNNLHEYIMGQEFVSKVEKVLGEWIV